MARPDQGSPASLSVFFPAYNDSGTIASLVITALQSASQLTSNYEVIVVNDGSSDSTAQILDELARIYPQVKVVTHEVNPVLPYVDRMLYLVDGRFRVGTVEEVMTSATLSELYRADIQVLKVGNRYVVVGEHLDHSGHATGHTHE